MISWLFSPLFRQHFRIQVVSTALLALRLGQLSLLPLLIGGSQEAVFAQTPDHCLFPLVRLRIEVSR